MVIGFFFLVHLSIFQVAYLAARAAHCSALLTSPSHFRRSAKRISSVSQGIPLGRKEEEEPGGWSRGGHRREVFCGVISLGYLGVQGKMVLGPK
ncbi:hypothetical protein GUJ93_ZPchr0013g37775 [Zizania palustris]|uniref:Secreted protein n=1 Tax=Zizania palustris TaxID=103762 RepID=A0A8J5X7U3_ZIZPA|nr:hypothetical protein GUJ93_ZPchr0013g37775 [Zizania palustris]